MSEIWDDRRKALEEEYFRRKERETIEKLRDQLSAETQAAAAPKCPRCHTPLTQVTHEGITIDRCGNCNGIWLDAGELEAITRNESDSWVQRFVRSFRD